MAWLRSKAVPVVDATRIVGENISTDGADTFGSSTFFAINGARYRALIEMLRTGVSVFVLDLDVVVIQDPLIWLDYVLRDASASPTRPTWQPILPRYLSSPLIKRYDLILQSDARDGASGLERD